MCSQEIRCARVVQHATSLKGRLGYEKQVEAVPGQVFDAAGYIHSIRRQLTTTGGASELVRAIKDTFEYFEAFWNVVGDKKDDLPPKTMTGSDRSIEVSQGPTFGQKKEEKAKRNMSFLNE